MGTSPRMQSMPNGLMQTEKSIWTFNGMPVSTADGDQIAPRAIPNGKGGAFIVWSDYRGKDADIYIHQIP